MFSGDISASGFDTGAMKTILFSFAIGETAGPSAAVKVPTMKSTSSFRTISRATRTASSALPLLSVKISCELAAEDAALGVDLVNEHLRALECRLSEQGARP